ncbi:adenosylcobinamide-GDP ribazoletransferase [Roseivivax sediminis]|uniref:Adenosylcobinamide-GDP ribazoletransferase n=1 Tax=Roseivivax sediminis TaxID=936889 RepID=A0A1I1U2P4_9RHOB|nr:adenosylcobinamide-GDP ribazoletransferase [Roseivivax sediminis]SFD63888.1 cobalamin-5'-phosphate synthase [Roseivivax sediminis]
MIRTRLAELQLAVMLLTRLPAGRLTDPAPTLAQARWAYPLAGLPIGAIGWAAQGLAITAGLPALAAALLAVGAMALATGALHHDGLADLADGLGGGRDRAHCLEIMRDSRIGSYGVLALILAVGLEASALAGFDRGAPLLAFLFLSVTSRLAMLGVSAWLPAARTDGLGQSAGGGLGRAGLAGAALAVGLGLALGPAALASALVQALAAAAVAHRAMRRIGGQTGDVLGAVQRVAEVGGWLSLVAF